MSARPPLIAIVSEPVVRYDAVAAAVADTWRFLVGDSRWRVCLLATVNELPGLPARTVSGLPELLIDRHFLAADLLIYHFGMWNSVYDALLVGNGHARQAVFFHNVTPAELVASNMRPEIERSFRQLNNLRRAERIWPVSETNADLLRQLDFDAGRIEVIPLAVGEPALARLGDKPASPIEILFLGRIAPSKGVRDLVAAIARMRDRGGLPPLRLRIVGNLHASDPEYGDAVLRGITEGGLTKSVDFVGTVDDATRDRLLREAHILAIPSYHEGFCKPVIEALRAGCIPVGYAAHNLRYIADGLCRMVPPGDVGALADALAETILDAGAAIRDGNARLRLDRARLTASEFAQEAERHVDQFRPERVAALIRQHVALLLAATPLA
jgi:glycosyltransferase involved in cell wall biosynthesis